MCRVLVRLVLERVFQKLCCLQIFLCHYFNKWHIHSELHYCRIAENILIFWKLERIHLPWRQNCLRNASKCFLFYAWLSNRLILSKRKSTLVWWLMLEVLLDDANSSTFMALNLHISLKLLNIRTLYKHSQAGPLMGTQPETYMPSICGVIHSTVHYFQSWMALKGTNGRKCVTFKLTVILYLIKPIER